MSGLSSAEAKLVSDVWKWSLWRSDDLCFFRFGVLEPIRVSGIAESCCAAGHQNSPHSTRQRSWNMFKKYSIPGVWPFDYKHTQRNKTGTESDIWELRLKFMCTDVTLACEGWWRFDTHRFLGRVAQKNLCPRQAWSSCCLWWSRSRPMADIPCCSESAPACCSLMKDSCIHLGTLWKVDHTRQWAKNCLGFIKICWAWLE